RRGPTGGGTASGRRRSWRGAAGTVHRRLAVVLGVWIVFQTLTGLVLLFRDPIEHHAHPGLTRHGRGDIGAAAALDAVRRRYPGEPIGPLATPAVSDGVYVVEAGERDVYVDPARARINGARDDDAGFLALVERLHRRFLFDELPGLSGDRLAGAGRERHRRPDAAADRRPGRRRRPSPAPRPDGGGADGAGGGDRHPARRPGRHRPDLG